MSGRFAVGVIVGALAALTPFLTPAVIVIGAIGLLCYGLEAPSDSATSGVVWISSWTVIVVGILLGLLVLALAFYHTPLATAFIVGTFLTLAAVVRHMMPPRGDLDGAA